MRAALNQDPYLSCAAFDAGERERMIAAPAAPSAAAIRAIVREEVAAVPAPQVKAPAPVVPDEPAISEGRIQVAEIDGPLL